MKKIVALQHNETVTVTPKKFDRELARILARVQDSSRSVVKLALRELRDLSNSINTSLIRSYEADQYIRDRREKLAQQRFYL